MNFMDSVKFTPVEPPADAGHDGNLFVTHEGVLDLMGRRMRCYRLNNGQAVIHKDDMEEFVAAALDAE